MLKSGDVVKRDVFLDETIAKYIQGPRAIECFISQWANEFHNPLGKPIEELKFKYVSSENTYEEVIPALDKRWCNKDYIYTLYTTPPSKTSGGEFPMGSKEDWLERLSLFIDDLNLLLQLDYHRFWSEVIYNSHSLDGISSFLQNAPPFYLRDQLPEDKDILKQFRKAQELVFLVLARLTRTKESEVAWMKSSTLGSVLYENFIISFPQLMEISLIYANDNFKEVTELINRVIEIQPKYMSDIKKSSTFICEVFRNFENQLNSRHEMNGQHSILSTREVTNHLQVGKLVYLMLDISYSLATFLQVCSQAAAVYHEQQLEARIANFYENIIPVLNKYLESQLGSGAKEEQYSNYQLKINISRHNLISAVHGCLISYLSTILQERNDVTDLELKNRVDVYLNTLTDCLSDHVFIRDYNSAFPIHRELNTLTDICPELDSLKRDFILESVSSLYDLPKRQKKDSRTALSEPGTSSRSYKHSVQDTRSEGCAKKKITGVELQSLISEVQDVLSHLGEGFVAKCLEYYDYVSADVINAVLEQNLPECLSSLDQGMPIIPPEEPEGNNGVPERVNVFDNDEFDIMTNDQVDITRVHRGKRQEKHKNLSELLDDKSHVRELRDVYNQLSLVEDFVDVNQYEDEYDDTYDDLNVSVGNEGETETEERRAFVVPRVLQQYKKTEEPRDHYEEDDDNEENEKGRPDHFIENPAEVRARAEQKKQEMRERSNRSRGSAPHRDVVGKPKGQGQDKDVTRSREFKNANKSSRGNHNRRAMAAKKRRQGMLPS